MSRHLQSLAKKVWLIIVFLMSKKSLIWSSVLKLIKLTNIWIDNMENRNQTTKIRPAPIQNWPICKVLLKFIVNSQASSCWVSCYTQLPTSAFGMILYLLNLITGIGLQLWLLTHSDHIFSFNIFVKYQFCWINTLHVTVV